jgi:hypothetical protein
MARGMGRLLRFLTFVTVTAASVLAVAAPVSATPTFQRGDLFAAGGIGVDDSHVRWLRPDGTLVATLDSGLQQIGGMAFDPTGRLAITGFLDNNVVRFAPDGTFLGTFIPQVFPFPGCDYPTEITYDRAGNLIVGDFLDCSGATKFDADGRLVGVVVGGESDFVDLDSDQCTLFVEDANDQITFARNICTGQPVPIPNYAQLSPGEPGGLRILPDGSILEVDSNAIRHYTRPGKLLRGYGENACFAWFGVTLGVEGKSFWSYCQATDTNTLFDVKTGSVLRTLSGVGRVHAVDGGFRAGLACSPPLRRCAP